MRKKLLLLLACLFVGIGLLTAQNSRKVTGSVVSSEDGQPVIGASVLVTGTKVGTVTDAVGNFTFNVPASAKTLTVSYVGMNTATVAIHAGKIKVELVPNTQELGEVIVVGYGTVRREAKTGSISTVDSKQITDIPASSVDKMLAGKMAGVQITTSTGQPGASSSIRIRGTSSINAGNEPLYVVDGIPVMSGDQSYFTNTNNAIAAINPDDIESITVLKDAASASVYGSRAANGVILITTKSGKEGKSNITVRAKMGFSCLANDNDYGVMNGEQLWGYQRQAAINAGYDPDDPTSNYYRPYEILTRPMTNWMDYFTRLGKMEQVEMTLSGGSAKTKYYSSFSYHKNDGIFYGIDFTRLQGRINADHEINKNWSTGVRINLGYMDQNDIPTQNLYYANPIWAGMQIRPWTPKNAPDGGYNLAIPENSNENPRATAAYDDEWEKQYRVNGNMYLQWKPMKGLTIKSTNAIEMTFNEGRRYWDPRCHADQDGTGTLQTSQMQYRLMTTSNTATYEGAYDKHTYRVIVGQEANQNHTWYNYESARKLNPEIPYHVSGNATNDVSYGVSTYSLMSFFGILDYNFDNRYFLSASVREDGCSKFGEDNKWGLFYSVGLSWNMHNEAFMKDVKWLQTAKFRLSYGVNGNNNIANYSQYGVYSSSVYNGVTGLLPSSPANKKLSWEKNKSWNFGIDFRFLQKFSGSFDLYTRKTTDMLLDRNQSYTSGFGSVTDNIGSLRNSGIEFQFDANIIDSKEWKWDVGFNIAHNKSKILALAGDTMMGAGDNALKHIVGEKLYTFYVRDYCGVNPANGEALWRTADGTISNNVDDAQYVKDGSPEPSYTGGVNTSVSWKNLSLSVVGEFKGGNKILIGENSLLFGDGSEMIANQAKNLLNYWKKVGDTGCNPKPIAGKTDRSYTYLSKRFIENGSYFRIKDVTLAYDFNSSLIKRIGLNSLRVYASGLNVYTFHNVAFWDPERGIDGMGTGIYPVTKTFVVGFDLSF
jgi:TonB-linked SusC/RagA family outer membrane protein